MNAIEKKLREKDKVLSALSDRGFKFVSETRGECDERGIDGVMILKKEKNREGKGSRVQKRYRYFVCAHYRVGNRYGEPLPILL